jgi:hypothetical protein
MLRRINRFVEINGMKDSMDLKFELVTPLF